jgi:diacylglycerol kinase family enzyme
MLHETRSLAELQAVAVEISHARPATVVLAGGDGSLTAALTALCHAYGDAALPRLALVPGGTVSTVARNYGFHGDPAPYTARLLARAMDDAGGPGTPAPTLRVTGDDGQSRVGFIFGTALVARFFEQYEGAGARGYPDAARLVARIFASALVGGTTARRVLTPSPARVTLDGVEQPARAYSLLVAATVRDLGLGMRVTYRAGREPSPIHVVGSALGPRALGAQLPLVLLGRRLRGRGHVDALAHDTLIRLGSRPAPYVLDGDLFQAATLTVRPGPTLALVAP